MVELPEIEREGEGYRVRPRGPLPRSWLNAGTLTGVSVAGAALLAVTLLGPVSGAGVLLSGLTGAAISIGSVLTAGFVGNVLHQREQDRAERDGVLIHDPGRLNRGLFTGAMQGFGKAGWITLGAALVGLVGSMSGFMGADPIAAALNFVAWPALIIGGVLAVTGAFSGSREYRDAMTQQVQNIESGIIYREEALARGQQPDLETARSAAIGNSVGLAAAASPSIAAGIQAIGNNGNSLPSQEPQFTEYAHTGEGWHPAHDRAEGHSFAQQVRPQRAAANAGLPSASVRTAASNVATPAASSPEAQSFANRVEAMRAQLAAAQQNASRTS